MLIATKRRSVALAGAACGGKSTVAIALAEKLDIQLATARVAIELTIGQGQLTRRQLVDYGALLEDARPGEWFVEALRSVAGGDPLVLDAVRTKAQLAACKRWHPRLLTVFLNAPSEVRRLRFAARASVNDMSFDELGATAVEQEAQVLGSECELAFDSSRLSSGEIVERILQALDVDA